jgi:hypothetical protein
MKFVKSSAISIFIGIVISNVLYAQNNVGIDTVAPAPSSILDLSIKNL